ncbi:MAG: hypothetical protein O7G88_00010 [bacterium]|nr:hypothetical protein [bacterium]
MLSAQYDRFSIVHVTLMAAVAAFWILAARVDGSCRWQTRLGLGLCGAVGVAVVMWLIFPAFYRGPLVAMDPGLWPIFLQDNREWEPVLSGRQGFIGPFIATLLLPLAALVLYAWRRLSKSGNRTAGRNCFCRPNWRRRCPTAIERRKKLRLSLASGSHCPQ